MSHPPIEHNPHVWADMGVHQATVTVQAPIPVQSEEDTVTAPADPAASTDGGEQPSVNPAETAESAGTDSSESSSPAGKSDSSGGKPNPKAARNAAASSGAAAKTGSSSAGSMAGAGTGQ